MSQIGRIARNLGLPINHITPRTGERGHMLHVHTHTRTRTMKRLV
jgi:hypothetical protein